MSNLSREISAERTYVRTRRPTCWNSMVLLVVLIDFSHLFGLIVTALVMRHSSLH